MCDKKKFYITTPIYYPSDKLHIGHSYCTVATDTMARYKRMQGYDVMFLTGTDEHGQKIEEKAATAGITPKQYVDNIVAGIKDLWKLMNISNDRFVRTTDDYHVESVQKIFKELYDKGEIYKGSYKGKYCTPCESFWTESQLVDGKCPDCGREVHNAEEEAYFFKLSNYGDKLLKFYKDHPDFLKPESRLNEMINNFIKPGLEDLCVSRTSFSWGIPVTFDTKHIVYVWVDALTNYITALGYGNDKYNDYEKYWPADVHFVGKEITRFHTIIWPAMLMALDLPLPKKVYGHGWLLLDGGKMSKSKGNVVDPVVLCKRYGVDALRYFLLREFPFGSDGVFSNKALITRINSDLANDLGNLVSRTLTMCEKYFGKSPLQQKREGEFDKEFINVINNVKTAYENQMENFAFQNGLIEVMKVISIANKYIDDTKPWILGKNENEKERLSAVIYNLLEAIRISARLLTPFMPDSCKKIISSLGIDEASASYKNAIFKKDTIYNVTRGEILFPRIDVKKELELLEKEDLEKSRKAKKEAKAKAKEKAKEKAKAKAKEQNSKETPSNGMISINDFAKVKVICCKIVDCTAVENTDKLLKFQLDDGTENGRQIVSSIHEYYEPADLIGKKIMVVGNLKPAKFRGVRSEGMLIACDVPKDDGVFCQVIFLNESIPSGTIMG